MLVFDSVTVSPTPSRDAWTEPHGIDGTRIQSQHLSYALIGIGIGLTKGLSEIRNSRAENPCQCLAAADGGLGLLLMLYSE